MWIKTMSDSIENVMLVVTGLFSSGEGMGKEGRFGLLHAPWSPEEFERCISNAIGADMWDKKVICEDDNYIEILKESGFSDSSVAEIFAKKVGLRIWIVRGKGYVSPKAIQDDPIWIDAETRTSTSETTKKRIPTPFSKKLERFVDSLWHESSSINTVWPNDDPKDRKALLEIERILTDAIKDRGVNLSLPCS
jgi:hypothetical protein